MTGIPVTKCSHSACRPLSTGLGGWGWGAGGWGPGVKPSGSPGGGTCRTYRAGRSQRGGSEGERSREPLPSVERLACPRVIKQCVFLFLTSSTAYILPDYPMSSMVWGPCTSTSVSPLELRLGSWDCLRGFPEVLSQQGRRRAGPPRRHRPVKAPSSATKHKGSSVVADKPAPQGPACLPCPPWS